MAGKIYKSYDLGNGKVCEVDSTQVADVYLKKAKEIASVIKQLEGIRFEFAHCTNMTDDSGDACNFMDKTICELGKCLAAALNESEYFAKEANGENCNQ